MNGPNMRGPFPGPNQGPVGPNPNLNPMVQLSQSMNNLLMSIVNPSVGHMNPNFEGMGGNMGDFNPNMQQGGPNARPMGPSFPNGCGMGMMNPNMGTRFPPGPHMGPDPRQMGPDPRQMGPDPRQMGPDPRQMGPDPRQMGPDPRQMGNRMIQPQMPMPWGPNAPAEPSRSMDPGNPPQGRGNRPPLAARLDPPVPLQRRPSQGPESCGARAPELKHQEKMFLPSVCESLDEGPLRQMLLAHLGHVSSKTGVVPQLRGGRTTSEKLHFYLGTNDEWSFNEAKRMIIVLVQSVVAEMQDLLAEEDDDEEGTATGGGGPGPRQSPPTPAPTSLSRLMQRAAETKPGSTAEDITRSITDPVRVFGSQGSSRVSEQEKVGNVIADQKFIFESKLRRPLAGAPGDGDVEVVLSDGEAPTHPQQEQRRREQLQKAVDILGCLSRGPPGDDRGSSPLIVEEVIHNSAPHQPPIPAPRGPCPLPFPPQPHPSRGGPSGPGWGPLFPGPSAPMGGHGAPPQRRDLPLLSEKLLSRLGDAPPSGGGGSSRRGGGKKKKKKNKDRGEPDVQVLSERAPPAREGQPAPPPPPLIDPALDYLYNPAVVETIHRTQEGLGGPPAAAGRLQVGYLPEADIFGESEEPYSEILSPRGGEGPRGRRDDRRRGPDRRDWKDGPAPEGAPHGRGASFSPLQRRGAGPTPQGGDPRGAPSQDHARVKAKLARERSLERKENNERRERYERYERERRFEATRREREDWERHEQRRRQRYEQTKHKLPEAELAEYESYEQQRRRRFECELLEWQQRERRHLKAELEEEVEAEREAKSQGRQGPPVVYVTNVCPATSEARLHRHFSLYGTVSRVVMLRTRQKNLLNAEVYYEKWASCRRAVKAAPGAHMVDGYTLRVSEVRPALVSAITRMEEYRVERRPESFDEILMQYKMRAEIQQGARPPSVREGDPAPRRSSTHKDLSPAAGGRRASRGSRGESEEVVITGVTLSEGGEKRPSYFEKSHMQKEVFSRTLQQKATPGPPPPTTPSRRLALLADPHMAYYDPSLAAQCQHPLLTAAPISVASCRQLIQHHWQGVARTPGVMQLYVVLPSLTLLTDLLTGDGVADAVRTAAVTSDFSDSFKHRQAVKRGLKSLHKHLRRVAAAEPDHLPAEMQLWLQLLSTAAADVDAFLATAKEDHIVLRRWGAGALSGGGEEGSQEGGDGSSLLGLFEVLARGVEEQSAPSKGGQDKENQGDPVPPQQEKTSGTPPALLQELLTRRVLHEVLALRGVVGAVCGDPPRDALGLVWAPLALSWVSPRDVKRAVAHIKRRQLVQQKAQLEAVVACLHKSVRLFNCLSRGAWAQLGCPSPLVHTLHDTLREEGEVEEGEDAPPGGVERLSAVVGDVESVSSASHGAGSLRGSVGTKDTPAGGTSPAEPRRRRRRRGRSPEARRSASADRRRRPSAAADMSDISDAPMPSEGEEGEDPAHPAGGQRGSPPSPLLEDIRVIAFEDLPPPAVSAAPADSSAPAMPSASAESNKPAVSAAPALSKAPAVATTVAFSAAPALSTAAAPVLASPTAPVHSAASATPAAPTALVVRPAPAKPASAPELPAAPAVSGEAAAPPGAPDAPAVTSVLAAAPPGVPDAPAAALGAKGEASDERAATPGASTAPPAPTTTPGEPSGASTSPTPPPEALSAAPRGAPAAAPGAPAEALSAAPAEAPSAAPRGAPAAAPGAPAAAPGATYSLLRRALRAKKKLSKAEIAAMIGRTPVTSPQPANEAPPGNQDPQPTLGGPPCDQDPQPTLEGPPRDKESEDPPLNQDSQEGPQRDIDPEGPLLDQDTQYTLEGPPLDQDLQEGPQRIVDPQPSLEGLPMDQDPSSPSLGQDPQADPEGLPSVSEGPGPDWLLEVTALWGREGCDGGSQAHWRNKGGYIIAAPPEDASQEPQPSRRKPRKPRTRALDSDLRKAACGAPTAPPPRIGPNAEQFLEEERQWKASQGRAPREGGDRRPPKEGADGASPGAQQGKSGAGGLPTVPYLRYVEENHPFRELLYCHNHRHRARLGRLHAPGGGEDLLQQVGRVAPLRATPPHICSFVVLVSRVGPGRLAVRWAQDLAHTFGLLYLPTRHADGWLLLSNESHDAAALVQLLGRLRLLDTVLCAGLHYGAAELPEVGEAEARVLSQRLKLFAEKYDNTAARLLQPALAREDSCHFFVPGWRNVLLGGYTSLYKVVADAVRSVARKQSGGWRRWTSGGVRVVAVVADVVAAVWCGGLLGGMAGKRGVSLVGGESILLGDVELADIVVATPSQLLTVLPAATAPKHPLRQLAALVLDDLDHLATLPATAQLLDLLDAVARPRRELAVVGVVDTVSFAALQRAEAAFGVSFPRTTLDDGGEGEELPEAAEEQLLLQQPPPAPPAEEKPSVAPVAEASEPPAAGAPSVQEATNRSEPTVEAGCPVGRPPAPAEVTSSQPPGHSEEGRLGFEAEEKRRPGFEEEIKLALEAQEERQGGFEAELEWVRAAQRRARLARGEAEAEEERRQKKEMERTMLRLKMEQKRRLEREWEEELEQRRRRKEANRAEYERLLARQSRGREAPTTAPPDVVGPTPPAGEGGVFLQQEPKGPPSVHKDLHVPKESQAVPVPKGSHQDTSASKEAPDRPASTEGEATSKEDSTGAPDAPHQEFLSEEDRARRRLRLMEQMQRIDSEIRKRDAAQRAPADQGPHGSDRGPHEHGELSPSAQTSATAPSAQSTLVQSSSSTRTHSTLSTTTSSATESASNVAESASSASVSTSSAAVSTSSAAVSTSSAAVSTSSATVSTSSATVSTSSAAVSTSTATVSTSSASSGASAESRLTAAQRKKLEQKRQLEAEKRQLQLRIQEEVARKKLQLEQLRQRRQQQLHNKMVQEQRKRKRLLQEQQEDQNLESSEKKLKL